MHFALPEPDGHVRIDSGVRPGDEISIHYDPMLAKLIVWDEDRELARRRLVAALGQVEIVGLANNVAFLKALADHPAFAAGEVDTGFIERHHDALFAPAAPDRGRVLAAAVGSLLLGQEDKARQAAAASADPHSPWHAMDGWRLNLDARQAFRFLLAGVEQDVVLQDGAPGAASWISVTAGSRSNSPPALKAAFVSPSTACASRRRWCARGRASPYSATEESSGWT